MFLHRIDPEILAGQFWEFRTEPEQVYVSKPCALQPERYTHLHQIHTRKSDRRLNGRLSPQLRLRP